VNVELRPARREDLPALMRYVHALHRLDRRQFDLFHVERALLPLLTATGHGCVWLIEAAGRPLGYLALCYGYSLRAGGRAAYIDGFYIEEEFRNRGIGTGVLRQVLGEARAAGIVAVHLQAGQDLERARRLLAAAGLGHCTPGSVLSAELASRS
jgi:GNAT superfamily N-acetyltransferase